MHFLFCMHLEEIYVRVLHSLRVTTFWRRLKDLLDTTGEVTSVRVSIQTRKL